MPDPLPTPADPWDIQPGEPPRWYTRFLIYLELGPARTITAAYQRVHRRGKTPSKGPSGWWTAVARRWQWSARALAYDIRQRDLLALSDRDRQLALRDRRVAIAEENIELAHTLLHNMQLLDLDPDATRAFFPQVRVLLRDMLAAERQEFDRLAPADPTAPEVVITSEDLRAAQRALETSYGAPIAEIMARLSPLPPDPHPDPHPAPPRFTLPYRAAPNAMGSQPAGPLPAGVQPAAFPILLVCLSPNPDCLLDLAGLRRVRAATGLPFKRVLDCTRAKFTEALRRERGFGHPVELLHLALPTTAAGVEFADGLAGGNWLSERLQGVRVLLHLGNCSEDIGDWLGVVPYVITVAEDIAPADAAVLTEHFWYNIGAGRDPAAALDDALAYCSPAVAEYVVRRW
jgi:hypothetical protein